MDDRQRVVVTGIGLMSPLGGDDEAMRERLFAGEGAVRRLEALDAATYRSQHAAEVDSTALVAGLDALGLRASDRPTDMALVVSAQALQDAGVMPSDGASSDEDTAVILGSGSGPSQALHDSWQAFFEKGPRGLRPSTVPRCMANVLSSQVSIRFGLRGANHVVVASCSSSTIAIGHAFRTIRHGYARRVLCGGSESMFTPALYASWDNLGVMSRNADPRSACRPFDRDRDGFVLGEGAGTLMLESLASARARGAKIRAEVLGYGESSDATHITRPSVEGQVAAMSKALASAGLEASAIGFVNAHGTATQANDVCEAASIRTVLGAAVDQVPVVSSKSYYGHLLGAAGAIEVITAIFCLEQGLLHPNLNLDHPDPACDVRLAGTRSEALSRRICMKNSFGFGGSNSTLILATYED